MAEAKFYCPICGAELIEKHTVGKCIYCGKEEETEYICPNGHYVCEDCRILSQKEITIKYLSYSKEKDVLKIMTVLLKHPSFNMFGKEHHFVLGPVVLTALKNQGKLKWDPSRNEVLIGRTEFLPYGVCGSIGTCGACSSVGATLSMLLKATYMSDRERSIVLDATSECLKRLARAGGPRCCKESVYVGLMVLNEYLKKYLSLDMGLPDKIVCAFSETNPECKKERCEFYNGKI
jgi:hypothetical protein